MKKEGDHTYTLTLHVHNQPGVLVRCAQVFARRGHNIESLHVAADKADQSFATMTIQAYGAKEMMDNIVAQLAKLIDVISVTEKETK
jgi:acetolactate synthase-1/3 small subunit